MANHKRHRNKSRRAGCLYCKPHKAQGNSQQAQKPQYRLCKINLQKLLTQA